MVEVLGERSLVPALAFCLTFHYRTLPVLCFETVNVFITKKLFPSLYVGSFGVPSEPDEEIL